MDWDYFDEQSLSSVAKLENGGFTNLSGQTYKAIVLPSMTVITRTGLDRLREFAKQGGKVIFVGKTPIAHPRQDVYGCEGEAGPELRDADRVLGRHYSGGAGGAAQAGRQARRRLPAPDLYAPASGQTATCTTSSTRATRQNRVWPPSRATARRSHWDLATGAIHPIAAATNEADGVKIPLVLAPYEAKVIVVGPLPKEVAAAEPSFAAGTTLAELTGDWNLMLNGKSMTTELKSWEDLGTTGFAGPATYRKQFTVSAVAKGKQVYLEIADVHDYAKVTLNGKDLGAAGWQPYRWDATGALKKGVNDLVIEVNALAASGRGGFGVAPPVAAPACTWSGDRSSRQCWCRGRRTPQTRRGCTSSSNRHWPPGSADSACNLRLARQCQTRGVLIDHVRRTGKDHKPAPRKLNGEHSAQRARTPSA